MATFFTVVGNKKTAKNPNNKKNEKLIAILEIVIIVFLTTFIPSLIKLGRPPQNLEEVWVELFVALLASVYAYARIRKIDIENTKN